MITLYRKFSIEFNPYHAKKGNIIITNNVIYVTFSIGKIHWDQMKTNVPILTQRAWVKWSKVWSK